MDIRETVRGQAVTREPKNEKSEMKQTLVGMVLSEPEELSAEIIELHDLETDVPVELQAKIQISQLIPVTRPRQPSEPSFLPQMPTSVAATGLSHGFIEELCLKHLFQGGALRGTDLVGRVHLPATIIEEIMERLRKNKLVEITGSSGMGLGRSSMVFRLTQAGHEFVANILERDRYFGPAPVPYKYYQQAVGLQTIRGNAFRKDDLEPHFHDLVLKPAVFDAIGPAMNSGKAMFLHGPPGNGKTAVCARMTACFGGDIFIPHAVLIDDFVIKVYDENLHVESLPERIAPSMEPNQLDVRWVACRRPMVVVGGELEMDDLKLRYSESVRYYEAPIQMKANNGMLLIDDFGRQRISPRELLNRWIVPLESEVDYLSMHTGKKLQVPFDVFVVFSTNLEPRELVDEAFLRRVGYKLEVGRPDEGVYSEIFRKECLKRQIPWDPDMVEYLIEEHYRKPCRPFNACEPRDLLSQVVDLSNYHGHKPTLDRHILDRVVANYFINKF
ncbi:ATPase [Myxococcota bacterium]|nr:ATPase [Myxococcota bacterium]MBU1510158.1 ATPase [Myxococcota bacterium]